MHMLYEYELYVYVIHCSYAYQYLRVSVIFAPSILYAYVLYVYVIRM